MFIIVDLPEPEGPMIATYYCARCRARHPQRLHRFRSHHVVAGQVADPDDGLAHERFASFFVSGAFPSFTFAPSFRSRIAW